MRESSSGGPTENQAQRDPEKEALPRNLCQTVPPQCTRAPGLKEPPHAVLPHDHLEGISDGLSDVPLDAGFGDQMSQMVSQKRPGDCVPSTVPKEGPGNTDTTACAHTSMSTDADAPARAPANTQAFAHAVSHLATAGSTGGPSQSSAQGRHDVTTSRAAHPLKGFPRLDVPTSSAQRDSATDATAGSRLLASQSRGSPDEQPWVLSPTRDAAWQSQGHVLECNAAVQVVQRSVRASSLHKAQQTRSLWGSRGKTLRPGGVGKWQSAEEVARLEELRRVSREWVGDYGHLKGDWISFAARRKNLQNLRRLN